RSACPFNVPQRVLSPVASGAWTARQRNIHARDAPPPSPDVDESSPPPVSLLQQEAIAGGNVIRRLPFRPFCLACLLAAAACTITSSVNAQSAGTPQSTGSPMPSDIDPRSGMRLSLPNREDLDEDGKKAYDRGMTPGASIAGLQGPSGIQLFSPKT